MEREEDEVTKQANVPCHLRGGIILLTNVSAEVSNTVVLTLLRTNSSGVLPLDCPWWRRAVTFGDQLEVAVSSDISTCGGDLSGSVPPRAL